MNTLPRKNIARARTRIDEAGLTIEEIDELRWRVINAAGQELVYFPLEDRWRQGSTWGRGTLTLILALKGT